MDLFEVVANESWSNAYETSICNESLLETQGIHNVHAVELTLVEFAWRLTVTVFTLSIAVGGGVGNVFALCLLKKFTIRRTIVILLGTMALTDVAVCLTSLIYYGVNDVIQMWMQRRESIEYILT